MRILKNQLRLRLENRKPRTFSRAASADDAATTPNRADDSTVSSPSTPNSSQSSHLNLIGSPSPNTPSPATPTQQSAAPLGAPVAPGTATSSSSGHKNSLKGTKLARRARSFKDDLISLMRTPTNTLGRSHSPHSPRNKNAKPPPTAEEVAKSSQSLEAHVKDISNALKHFCDVILKNKLEVLPGNGTVILETIASMYAVIQSYALNDSSPVLLSATQQVYQSLGKLIKLCDEVMLNDESGKCASLSVENVREVVNLLEDAVKNLVALSQQKLKEKEESAFKYAPSNVEVGATATSSVSHNHLMRPPVDVPGQRTSLPDITLTPKERDILEKTNSNPIRASHSTESILRDTSPPPKPPLPNRSNNPPPLPPKPRSQQQNKFNHASLNSQLDCGSDYSLAYYGADQISSPSARSRSPDVNSSQCSLDSALNHSRDEDELQALDVRLDNSMLEDDVEKMFACKSRRSGKEDNTTGDKNVNNNIGIDVSDSGNGGGGVVSSAAPCMTAGIRNAAITALDTAGHGNCDGAGVEKAEIRKTANNRHSNESGFVSINSFRTSTQSASKRSSDYSFQSSSKSSNSEIVFSASETSSSTISEFHQQHMKSITTTAAMEQHVSSSSKISSSSICSSTTNNEDNHSLGNTSSSASPYHFDCENLLISQMQSMSSLTKINSLDVSSSDDLTSYADSAQPPALPPKTSRSKELHLSQFENFDDLDDVNSFNVHDLAELRPHHQQNPLHLHQYQFHVPQWQTKHQSLIESRRATGILASCNDLGSDGHSDEPPPLPMKKKHILVYMELCSGPSRSIEQHRHTMHAYNSTRNQITHSQTMNIVPLVKNVTSPNEPEIPPALPPKNYKQRKPTVMPPTIITTPPPSPKPTHLNPTDMYGENGRHGRVLSQGSEAMTTVCEEISDLSEEEQANIHHSHNLPDEHTGARINDDQSANLNAKQHIYRTGATGDISPSGRTVPVVDEDVPIGTSELPNEEIEHVDNKNCAPTSSVPNMLDLIDITPYLVVKKETEDGPEVKGGYIDALIVHASRAQKVSDAFSEAFITTFRTFIQPIDVIEKLTHRYTILFCQLNDQKQRAAKETFSLLVRVVNDLTLMDLTNQLLTLLVEFVYQLVCSGQLYHAKLLRNKFVEKVTLYKEQKIQSYELGMYCTVTNQPSLLDLKSMEIAEQMTLLDSELFRKIEIPEVLLFAKEQCEERSPNLNKFTEHFNKMSYWVRSRILLAEAKEREKHVIKFIKIMKHLRKMNNYNSYLALLSALDSAPIRRLEWHKTITEGLKEYCTLIDSSSSFRVYRQALAETSTPCIPYIGLVLQDLTFVHVGNPDFLRDGVINFSKRWQQHNIIMNIKRFKECSYPFRRNERIIHFFENFENFLGEEEMWQISEAIKPRGKRPVHN